MAILNGEFQSYECVEDGATELGEHGKAFAPAWAPRGLVTRGLKQAVVDAEHVEGVLPEFGEVGSGLTAEAAKDCFEETGEEEELLGEAVAKAEARTIGEDERGDEDSDDNSEQHLADAMKREQPVGPGLLDEHDDGDGDSGEARTVAEAQKSAEYDGEQYGKDVVPGQRAEQGEGETESCADECAENSIARGSDGRAEVGLKDDDGADRAPIAVVDAEAECDAPAKGGS